MSMRTLPLLLRSLWSRTALAELYEKRQALRPSEENRTPLAVGVAGGLFLAVMGFLMLMAWSRGTVEEFLDDHPSVNTLEETASEWQATPPRKKRCGSAQECFASERSRLETQGRTVSLADPELSTSTEISDQERIITMFHVEVDRSAWADLSEAGTLTGVLPAFRFDRADLWVNGEHQRQVLNGEPLFMNFDPEIAGSRLRIDVVFELSKGLQSPVVAGGTNRIESAFNIMPREVWQEYERFVAAGHLGRGNYIGMIARIVMAVFVLVLFLVVDGSPESLGLSLFLGFEAFAISTSFDWLPLEKPAFVTHFAYQMGDLFRLFFFLQLARMIDTRVTGWLLWGTVLSIPYGLLRHFGPQYGLTELYEISRARDFIIGIIGVVVCVRSATFLWGRGLSWRVTALLVAALGSLEQTVQPLGAYIPVLQQWPAFTTVLDVLQPMSAWLLAFSAFINISTLENRVRELSAVQARAQKIQHEMELGQTVQRAFHNIPNLPPPLKVICHHEAMLYVSGDTYYVHWDPIRQRLAFIVNDVTGHGVQAALKASATHVIAQSLWDRGPRNGGAERLAAYDTQVHSFLEQMSDRPEIHAMGGGEFDPSTGQLHLYRANFPFPILVEPKEDLSREVGPTLGEFWNPRILPVHNQEVTTLSLVPGSFLVLSSDGFLEGSRRHREVLLDLRRALSTKDHTLRAEALKEMFVRQAERDPGPPDDKTLLIFHWDVRAAGSGGLFDENAV